MSSQSAGVNLLQSARPKDVGHRDPKCDFVAWQKPIAETCPQCQTPYLLQKTTKKDGTVRYCNEESCDYKAPVEAA